MDASEKLAADTLAYLGFKNVVFEPDGNVPPDFLIDGRIAVEVRRLNQNHTDGVDIKGLEEISIHLWHRVRILILSLGPPTQGKSWFVYYQFRRPVERWKALKPKLTAELKGFIASDTHKNKSIKLGNGFDLEIRASSKVYSTFYVPAGHSDEDSGGWLLSEMEKNLKFCIQEKTRKIAYVKSKYPEWWLIFSDHIGYSLNDFERELFLDQVLIRHTWDKVILVDPRDHTRMFEI